MKPSILSWLACLAIFAFLTPSLFPSSSSSSIVVFALADEEEFQSFDPFQEEEDEEEEQQQEVEEQTIFDQEEDDDFFAEVGETGTIKRQAAAARTEVPPGQVSISFQNNLEEDLILYWLNENDGSEFVMGEIAAGQGMGVNSFLGHRFTARGKESLKTASPSAYTVTKDKQVYSFHSAPEAKSKTTTASGSSSSSSSSSSAANPAPKPFVKLLNSRSTSAAAKFRSLVPKPIDIFFEDGKGGLYQGSLETGKEYTVNSYEGHVFFFTEKGNKKKILARHTVNADQVLYKIEDPNNPPPPALIEYCEKELAFQKDYFNRTGVQWRHYFSPEGTPRPPPVHHMWTAPEIGFKHQVISNEGYWTCLDYSNPTKCHSTDPVTLELEVTSLRPKAFIIKNFLNDLEAEAIIDHARPRISKSYVGNRDGGGARKSDTRTSENTWVPRDSFPVIESLFRRAEHLLKIPRLDRENTEDLQVVHYVDGQKYDSHHDWGVSGYVESRFITLLLYLTDMEDVDAGGETAFPKGADGKGFKIHPGKGSAVLFYNLLEDGNGDDLALHAALPVKRGEKWLANFWVWDPKRK